MFYNSFLDFPVKWQINFQDPATAVMEGIIELHNTIFFFLIIITVIVFWMFAIILRNFSYQANNIIFKNSQDDLLYPCNPVTWLGIINRNIKSQNINHNSLLEIIWVILPAIVLIFIAIPSFTILYSMDEIFDPFLIVKVIGHQWYWSYEYADVTIKIISKEKLIETSNNTINSSLDFLEKTHVISGINFDAVLLDVRNICNIQYKQDILAGYWSLRLLETDSTIYLPTKTHVQLLFTSDDVIHSWAVPSLGVKVDCVPGRLNQITLFIKRPGVFYGQCSEICGINHGYMPIKVCGLQRNYYLYLLNEYKQQYRTFFDLYDSNISKVAEQHNLEANSSKLLINK